MEYEHRIGQLNCRIEELEALLRGAKNRYRDCREYSKVRDQDNQKLFALFHELSANLKNWIKHCKESQLNSNYTHANTVYSPRSLTGTNNDTKNCTSRGICTGSGTSL